MAWITGNGAVASEYSYTAVNCLLTDPRGIGLGLQ